MRIPPVIEQYTASSNTVFSPMMDRAFVVRRGSDDVRAFGAVVKGACRDVREMPETVPLRSGLRVEMIQIVVGDAFGQGLDLVLESFAAECWLVGNVQGEVDGHDLAGSDFFRGCGDACWGEQVQATDL